MSGQPPAANHSTRHQSRTREGTGDTLAGTRQFSGRRALLVPRPMQSLARALACCVGLVTALGCTGRGDVVMLDVRSTPPTLAALPATPKDLRIAVLPLEESRTSHLWNRTHLWGGKTYFRARSGFQATLVAKRMMDFLRKRGWQAWVAKAASDGQQSDADVTLTGHLQEFSVYANSHLGFTHLNARLSFEIRARNVRDGSTAHMVLSEEAFRRVFWFGPEDVQEIASEMLDETLRKFVRNAKVENRALRFE
ncbi:MAG: hypothetical protein ACRDGM_08590 [bacterium]